MHTANPLPQQIQKVIDYQVVIEHGARQLKPGALSSLYSFKCVPLSFTCNEKFYFFTYLSLTACHSAGIVFCWVECESIYSVFHFPSHVLHSHVRFNSYGWAKNQLHHWTWLLFLFWFKRIEGELINCTNCFLCPWNFLLPFYMLFESKTADQLQSTCAQVIWLLLSGSAILPWGNSI